MNTLFKRAALSAAVPLPLLSLLISPVYAQVLTPIDNSLAFYFPVGTAIDSSDLTGLHANLLTQHFNSVTSRSDMLWSAIEPSKGTLTSATADAEVAFALSKNMQIRGQTLVEATGANTPLYAFADGTNSPANQAVVTANIQEHVQTVVQHFGASLYAWDVVSDLIDPSQPDCLYHGQFYGVLGKSYVDIALQAARQYAPPGTRLYINDNTTTTPSGLACMISVAQDLQNRGIPIDGVGHEMHVNIDFPGAAAVTSAVTAVANLGLDNQVTQFDESVYNAGDNTSNYGAGGGIVPPSVLAQQGYLYENYFKAFRQLKGKISAVTIWGLADDDTWLDSFPVTRLDAPLPFDTNLQAKPAYWGIVDPTQLPGWGLGFTISSKTGYSNARVWTIDAANSGPGAAFTTAIGGFTLTQVAGAACIPIVTPPSGYPILLGDIAAGGSASVSFAIDFTGCPALARFALSMPWSAANGADAGTFSLGNQFR
jgi:endo-1,4-beta-xylanase